jgi:hypothetical protein
LIGCRTFIYRLHRYVYWQGMGTGLDAAPDAHEEVEQALQAATTPWRRMDGAAKTGGRPQAFGLPHANTDFRRGNPQKLIEISQQ